MEAYIMQEIWLPLQIPLSSDRIVLRVMDYDSSKSDEIAGSMNFKLSELMKMGEENHNNGTFFW